MIRNKFQFKTISNVIQMDWEELKMSMREFDDGELIVRKRISWDTAKMNKFFHGVVLGFIRSQFRDFGTVTTKDEVKNWVKDKFLDREDRNGVLFPRSTASLGRDEYIKFLKDIDEFCQDKFGCGLPEPEKID